MPAMDKAQLAIFTRRIIWGGLYLAMATALVSSQSQANPADLNNLSKALQTIGGDRMERDVDRLSSPEFNGRQTGTFDDLRSGLFVARRFHELGLVPSGTQPLGPFLKQVGGNPEDNNADLASESWIVGDQVPVTGIQDRTRVEFVAGSDTIVAHPGEEYLPIFDSPSVDVIAPLVFVGYGISDPAHGIDDYAGVDVHNRAVLFLRGRPGRYAGQVRHADKVRVAKEKGAAAYLTVTGPILSAYEARRGLGTSPLAFYGNPDGEEALPGAWISTDLAEKILAVGFAKAEGVLREVQDQLNRLPGSRSAETKIQVHLSWNSTRNLGLLANIQGAIFGRDPNLQKETVVIGAHRDHFGTQAGLLFPGADDNASGTAVLLEVARALKEIKIAPKRTILFVSFSGEEQNLLGSRLYVRQPARPLTSTVAMLNVDHAGVGNGRLTIGVAGLSKGVAKQAGETAGLAEKLDLYGFFPGSDHVPFSEAGVPTVAIVSGGPHAHFHQSSDRPESIQPRVMEAVARFLLALAWQLAN